MRQQKLLADKQVRCLECGALFVPLHKDLIQSWADNVEFEGDWISAVGWATDATYKENLKHCSVECITAAEEKRKRIEYYETWLRFTKKHGG